MEFKAQRRYRGELSHRLRDSVMVSMSFRCICFIYWEESVKCPRWFIYMQPTACLDSRMVIALSFTYWKVLLFTSLVLDRSYQCSLGWPGTPCVAQDCLKLRIPCLYFPSVGITDVNYQINFIILCLNFSLKVRNQEIWRIFPTGRNLIICRIILLHVYITHLRYS